MNKTIFYDGKPIVKILAFGFKRTRMDTVITANQLEVFNNILKEMRSLSIVNFIELTFNKLNIYFIDRRARYEKELSIGNNFLTKVRQLLSVL